MNGMRITALTTVKDDFQAMLSGGLAPLRLTLLRCSHQCVSVISALPFNS